LNRTTPLHDFSLPSVAFDESDVRRCLPGRFDKGRPYQRRGAVRDLRADKGGQRLIASVNGTRPRPYHVFVEIGDSDPVSLSARCSCPVGWNCKHAAAVLLEALQNPPPIERAEENPLMGPVGGWLHQLRQAALPPASPEAIVYRLDSPPQPGSPFVVDLRVVRVLKSGGWSAGRTLPSSQLQNATANYLMPVDRAIIQLLRNGSWSSQLQLPEDPEIVDLAMRRMIATGRCHWHDLASPPMALGPARHGGLAWQLGPDGRQTIGVTLGEQSAIVLPSASPWYVLPGEHLAGPVELELHIESDAASFDVEAVLSIVRPDGVVLNLTQGYASVAAAAARPLRLDMRATCATVPAGFALRLSIAGASFPAYPVNPGTGTLATEASLLEQRPVTIAVLSGTAAPSAIALPILAPSS